MATDIQWTDDTWNPVTGCSKVSLGCKHCYAEGVANRFWAKQYPQVCEGVTGLPVVAAQMRPRQFTDVQCHEERLDQPLRWKKPRKVFVNSMSDLFHEDVPDYFIARVFAVMAWSRQHTFQILTKRHGRMQQLVSSPEFRAEVAEFVDFFLHDDPVDVPALRWNPNERRTDDARAKQPDIEGEDWPLPNVWLGVSCENQRFVDERIPLLLQTPAAIRFISAEPLLGPVDIAVYMKRLPTSGPGWKLSAGAALDIADVILDWVIVGGESGAGARPFDVAWARSIVAQCQSAGVPVFVKQLGAFVVDEREVTAKGGCHVPLALRDRKGGDMSEWPAALRVRQFPVRPAL